MADEKKEKEKHEKNPFHGFKFGNLFKKKEDDPVFSGYKESFKKQRAIAIQYNAVFQKFEECLINMVECQEKLHNIVEQTYESDWVASYELKEYVRGASVEWTNYKTAFAKLVEEQKNYLTRFDELKKKISYRRKKRDEFEAAKKDLEGKQQAKKPDPGKIATAELDFNARKSEFEKVDAELQSELPEFYESRVTFYQKNVGTLVKSDKVLFGELLEYLKRAATVFDGVNGTETKQKSFTRLPSDAATNPFAEPPANVYSPPPGSVYPQVPKNDSVKGSPTPRQRITVAPAGETRKNAAPTPPQHSPAVTSTPTIPAKPPRNTKLEPDDPVTFENSPGNPFLSEDSEPELAEQKPAVEPENVDVEAEKPRSSSNSSEGKRESVEPAVPPERSPKASRSPQPDSPEVEDCIRKVKATHKYSPVEEDELAFEKGDVIEVLPWLLADDAEVGWLRGRRESDGKCGVFPENFTKPLPV